MVREAQKFYVLVTDQTEPLKGIIDQLANNSSGTRGEITYRFTDREGPDTTTQSRLEHLPSFSAFYWNVISNVLRSI